MEKSAFIGELMGTMMLVLLGNGVVANVLLKGSKGENGGWMVITAGWAFAVTMGIFTSNLFGSPDAHLNPAVTVAMAISSGKWGNVGTYITAQMIGGFLGAVLVWVHHLPHWAKTEDVGNKLAAFSNSPAIRNTFANLTSEIIGTVVLIVGIKGIGTMGVSAGLAPLFVGILVWSIGLSLGGPTGYAINPARDLAPRIAHAVLPIAGKGDSDWNYAWIPVAGPIIGGIIGGLLIMMVG
jgi:glycerol uptake facilitator protein